MTVSLKEDALVLVSEDDGSLPLGRASPLGLYYHDTQFVSGLEFRVNGVAPVLLSANTEHNYVATFQLTNPAASLADGRVLPAQSLSIRRTRFLADGWRERIGILNATPQPERVLLELEWEAAFRDMFAVRGYRGIRDDGAAAERAQRDGALCFARVGRDGVRRTTEISARPAPDVVEGGVMRFARTLGPQEVLTIELTARPAEDGLGPPTGPPGFDDALDALNASYRRYLRSVTRYRTSSETLDETLIARSGLDLRALIERDGEDIVPTAGIPWYAVPFGRDALIASYQTLGWDPDLARGTLRVLARYQGTRTDEHTEEEPGKIFHELRRGELARAGLVPHRPYYGTVDATPLFVVVFAETVRWTADRALWRELLPAAERALAWCDGPYGDPDRDGYVEYGVHRSELRNQGWKDSAISLCDPDGKWSELPAALVEVQSYVYAAKVALAELYALDGDARRADALRREARELRERFERDFWMPAESCYAQALDARKRQVPAVTSNAGHALWCGLASDDRAAALVRRLMAPDMFTGWGIRTLSSRYPTYNPMSYHNGSVWPHDSSIVAHGFARYGFRDEAAAVVEGLFEAGKRYPQARLPELFCGFARDLRFASRPADYLVSCIPQAWSAGMTFLCLRALLGLEPDLGRERLVADPALPDWLPTISVEGMRVLGARASFTVRRGGGRHALEVAEGPVVAGADARA